MRVFLSVLALMAVVDAFTASPATRFGLESTLNLRSAPMTKTLVRAFNNNNNNNNQDDDLRNRNNMDLIDGASLADNNKKSIIGKESNKSDVFDPFFVVTSLTAAFWACTVQVSEAEVVWEISTSRTVSLAHPATNGLLFLFTLFVASLGLQWRRQRTIGDEITSRKKSLPDLAGASTVTAAISAAKEEDDSARVNKLQSALSIEKEIKDLQSERKELSSKNPRDKHFNLGSILALVGITSALFGSLNTYGRTGKLFPGPHLFVGVALVFLWSLAVAMVPFMSKGNDTARTVHIGANVLSIGLFGWQIVTGIPILLKTWEQTNWL